VRDEISSRNSATPCRVDHLQQKVARSKATSGRGIGIVG
jgi:hypothetical protein